MAKLYFVILSCAVISSLCSQETSAQPPRTSEQPPQTTEQPNTEERDANEDGVYVKCLGRSGKIRIGRKPKLDEDANAVTVEFDEISEVDNAGHMVGRGGQRKHVFNTFANQIFKFSQVQNDTYQNIPVKKFNFTAHLRNERGQFNVDILIFREDGNVTQDGERSEVRKGDVKFNIGLDSWRFCGGVGGEECRSSTSSGSGSGSRPSGLVRRATQRNETGDAVKVVITIRGKREPRNISDSEPRRRRGDTKELDLGSGARLGLSKKVQVDGQFVDMAPGFPKLEMRGNKQSFVFLLPRGNNIMYDPTISTGEAGDIDSTTTTTIAGNDINGSGANTYCLITILLAMVINIF